MYRPLAALCFAGLAACSAIDAGTAARLQALSPVEADPAALRVAVLMPEGLRPLPGTARVQLMARRSDTGATDGLDIVLAETEGDESDFDARAGETMQFYAVAEKDVAPMRALQRRIAAWDAEAPDATTGSLSVGIGGCKIGDGPATDATGSVFIRTEADGPFLPLIDRGALAGLIGPDALAMMGPCPER